MNNNDYMYYDEHDFNVAHNKTFSDDEVVDFDDLTENRCNNCTWVSDGYNNSCENCPY